MRTAATCLLVALAGCAQVDPVEEPQGVEVPIAAVVEEPLPPVPQDALNLAQLEQTRKFNDPLHRDLANGRFRGAKLEELIAEYPPDLLLAHDDFTTAVYAGGHPRSALTRVVVSARNGRLVYARGSSCTWWPVFFNGLTDEERKAWNEGYQDAFRKHFGIPNPPPPAPPVPVDDTIPPPREVRKPNP